MAMLMPRHSHVIGCRVMCRAVPRWAVCFRPRNTLVLSVLYIDVPLRVNSYAQSVCRIARASMALCMMQRTKSHRLRAVARRPTERLPPSPHHSPRAPRARLGVRVCFALEPLHLQQRGWACLYQGSVTGAFKSENAITYLQYPTCTSNLTLA